MAVRKSVLVEGEFFCNWLNNRLIKQNKNVLGAETGATGSGKSYRDLRKVELWYKFHFKEDFPTENICFGVLAVMERLNSKELRRGDILIFEEAGVSLGSLDFQNKVSKLFTYILQSFRSMNVGIFMNLPYESMLNKTARTLLHYTFESDGINFGTRMNQCKPKFNQVNQSTGKVYKKYGKAKINGKMKKIRRISFALPEKRLIDAYETKKAKYLMDLTAGFTAQLQKMEDETKVKMERKDLTEKQKVQFQYEEEGKSLKESAERTGISIPAVHYIRKTYKKNGFKPTITPTA